MALAMHALKAIAPYLKNASVLSLGYPDILATAEQCQELFGVTPSATIEGGAQHHVDRPLVETQELFKLLGSRFECVDVVHWRGLERICDLNYPQELGQFDLVIDPGTTEHCFNIGQAMMNAANAVKPGGRIYHSPPMTMINHGFYNICPTMLQDFYGQNGWEIETMEARKGELAVPLTEKTAAARKVKVNMECGLVCIARRKTAAALHFPMQGKYVSMKEAMAA
jgi:SAM-dependent methyltransferase